LETALIDAASQPRSDARLRAVVDAGSALTAKVDAISDTITAARQTADGQIATTVDEINIALSRLQVLNTDIAAGNHGGRDVSALLDRQQQLVDSIATHIPLREIDRGDGRIALISKDGATLLDGRAAVLGFQPTGLIVPGMTLSGLTLDGQAVPLSGAGGVGGGALGAQFQIRDTVAVQAQQAVDGFAADIDARFAQSGLFTDAVAAEPWRLRDGLNAAAPSAGGDATRLNAMLSAMKGASATELVSGISTRRIAAEGEAAFATVRSDTLRVAELAEGVDTDTEMQKLLLIEQSYAANAKVIQTVDAMMQTLLGIMR